MKQANQQMSEQQKQQELQNIRQNTEAKTIVNGKEVPLKEALKAEELFNEQNTQTGITQAHDNSSEAVKAGGFAQNTQQGMQQSQMQGQQSQKIKQSDVQSGQKEIEKHLEEARQQVQQEEQQAQQQAQQSAQQMQQQKQQAGYNIQPKGNVNSKLEEKAQQFNEASPLQPHEEASQEATKQTKAKGQKN
jgi:hypothetical protein